MIKNLLVLPVFAVSFIAGSNPSDEKGLVPYNFEEKFNTNVSRATKGAFPYIINTIAGHDLLLNFGDTDCIKVSLKGLPEVGFVFLRNPYTRHADSPLDSNLYQISLTKKNNKFALQVVLFGLKDNKENKV